MCCSYSKTGGSNDWIQVDFTGQARWSFSTVQSSKVNVIGPPRHDMHKRIGNETKINKQKI